MEAAYCDLVAQCAHEARWAAVHTIFEQAALAVLAPLVNPSAELAKARAARLLAGDWSVIET